MVPELEAHLDRVPALDPSEIVGELVAVVRVEPGTALASAPSPAQGRIRDVAGKTDLWQPRTGFDDATAVRAPQPFWPSGVGGQSLSTHVPAVIRERRVVHDVVGDDVVELLVQVVGGDRLVEALTEVIGVLLKVGRGDDITAAHASATARGGTVVLEVARRRPEVVREGMVHAEQHGLDVERPSLVSGPSVDIERSTGTVRLDHLVRNQLGGAATHWMRSGDHVVLERVAHWDSVDGPCRGRVEDPAFHDRPAHDVGAGLLAG